MQLQPQGWTRRFTAFGRRLSEATALYEQLGYDVRLEPAKVSEAEAAVEGSGCQSCFVMAQARTHLHTTTAHEPPAWLTSRLQSI